MDIWHKRHLCKWGWPVVRYLSIPVFPKLWDTELICTEYAQKLSIESSLSHLESQTSIRQPTAKPFGSIPIWLKSQASVRRPTLKLFGSSPSRLESSASVCQPSLKLFGSSPRPLSFGRRRNCRLTSQPYVPRPSQPLMTHILDVYHPPVTETKMSPIVCTAQN